MLPNVDLMDMTNMINMIDENDGHIRLDRIYWSIWSCLKNMSQSKEFLSEKAFSIQTRPGVDKVKPKGWYKLELFYSKQE